MTRSDEIAELAKALAQAQAAMSAAKLGAENPGFKRDGKASKYATLADVWEACREPLAANGLSVVQTPARDEAGIQIETLLLHTSGQWIADTLAMPLDSRANAQAVGSAITYGRRYSLAAFVGVAPADDDDGNAAANAPPTSDAKPKNRPPKSPPPEAAEYERAKAKLFALLTEYRERMGVSRKDAMTAAGVTSQRPTIADLQKATEYVTERLGALDEADAAPPPTETDPRDLPADELPKWAGGEAPDENRGAP